MALIGLHLRDIHGGAVGKSDRNVQVVARIPVAGERLMIEVKPGAYEFYRVFLVDHVIHEDDKEYGNDIVAEIWAIVVDRVKSQTDAWIASGGPTGGLENAS